MHKIHRRGRTNIQIREQYFRMHTYFCQIPALAFMSSLHPEVITEMKWKCMMQQAARNKRMSSNYRCEL